MKNSTGFRLLIECTKDIDSLNINFADGSTSVVHSPDEPSFNNDEPALDLSEDSYEKSTESIQLPSTDISDRPVNVASELQSLDI